jgi:hypothetical protein
MGIARSTYYDSPEKPVDDTSIVEAMFAICDEFEFYGYRRVGAALRQQGLIINHKKNKASDASARPTPEDSPQVRRDDRRQS